MSTGLHKLPHSSLQSKEHRHLLSKHNYGIMKAKKNGFKKETRCTHVNTVIMNRLNWYSCMHQKSFRHQKQSNYALKGTLSKYKPRTYFLNFTVHKKASHTKLFSIYSVLYRTNFLKSYKVNTSLELHVFCRQQQYVHYVVLLCLETLIWHAYFHKWRLLFLFFHVHRACIIILSSTGICTFKQGRPSDFAFRVLINN